MKSRSWILPLLSLVIVVLAIVTAAGGLLMNNLYRDPPDIQLAWYANDCITLLLVVPLLVFSAVYYIKKGNARAEVIWLGSILYMFYNYAFYLFGSVFNAFFLIYVALFSLSLYALILGLYHVNIREIKRAFLLHKNRKIVSGFLLLIALPLGIFEVSQVFGYILSGREPSVPTLIFALDLSIVIPNCLLAAVLLWKHDPWGYVVAAMMLVKAFTYGCVLVLSTILAAVSGSGNADPLLPFYFLIAAGGLFFGWMLLRHGKTVKTISV